MRRKDIERDAKFSTEIEVDEYHDPMKHAAPEKRAEIMERLAEDDETAWCVVFVEAKLPEFDLVGIGALYGVTMPAGLIAHEIEEEMKEIAERNDLRAEALKDLERAIKNTVNRGVALEARYGTIRTGRR